MKARLFVTSTLCASWLAIWAIACGDDSAQPSDDASVDGAQDAPVRGDVRLPVAVPDGVAANFGSPGDAGCYSAADCTDAGPHALCCFLMSTFTIACVPQGGMCDFQQCQVCDNECPVGLSCVPSMFGGKIRYCGPADGGGGSDGSGSCGSPEGGIDAGDAGVDGGNAGDSSDGGSAVDSGGDVDGGLAEAAADAPADRAADVIGVDGHD